MKSVSVKKWIIIFAALFIVCAAAFLLLSRSGDVGKLAVIRLDGEVYEKIDLDAVAVAYDIKIETEGGYNIIHVEHGAISVSEADCRDQICVRQGTIDSSGVPIVCMPHKLTIEIEGDETDA